MAKKNKRSDIEILMQYSMALTNAENQATIKVVLEAHGYNAEKFAEGKSILEAAKQKYTEKHNQYSATSEAHRRLLEKKQVLQSIYMQHRKKAKVVFRKNKVLLDSLSLSGTLKRTHTAWMETLRDFYLTLDQNTELLSQLERLKITQEEITNGIELLNQVEQAKSLHLKRKGESQHATKLKDKAMESLKDWMFEFYAIAKIGLIENPQLLEALGKVVKS